jgi:1A family penicillin-binding protein
LKHHPTRLIFIFGGSLLFFLGVGLTWLFWGLPSLDVLPDHLAVASIRITDRYGRTLYDVLDKEGGRHTPVPLRSIPNELKLATIATEDHSFYSNLGVDLVGILRALWINLRGGETLAGGSTITQQVARNLILGTTEQYERTLRRKLRESWLAWRLTQKLSKDEILGLYLNQIYYGGLAYGVEAASQTYFGKPVSELNLAECALIAGIPQGPALYNPLVDPEAAQNRQRVVLDLMRNEGFITQEQYNLAYRQPLVYTPTPYPIEAPHFVMMVSAQVDQLIPPENRDSNQNLVVRTTLDLNWQHLAERAVQKHLQALLNNNPTLSAGGTDQGHNIIGGHNVNNAALVALNPNTGEILSLVGSPDYFDPLHAGAINMAISPRQPGSALKPLVYASAFNPYRSSPYTAATMILDVQTTFTTNQGKAYTPANYDNIEHGPVSAREALASSLNIPAVKTLNHIGMTDLFELANDIGITTLGNPDDYDLSLALGGGEVTLLELTAAYGSFADQGYRVYPFSILDITTLEGEILYEHESPSRIRVVDQRVAWLISDILNDNDARTPGFGANSALKIDRPAAVKTGTTTNFHDNWTIGYTPDLVVGVWVGNANHEPMRAITGLTGAGPIWHQFIREALTGTPEHWFQRPKGLTQVEICALSGLLPTDSCPYTKLEWFIDGTEPTIQDNIYHKVWIDSQTGILADKTTPPDRRTLITALALPPEAQPWARAQGLIILNDLQGFDRITNIEQVEYPIKIVSPGQNTVFKLNPTLDPDAQRIHIEVVSAFDLEQVDLWLDGILLTKITGPPFEIWWPLTIGEHSLWAESITPSGDSLQSAHLDFVVESAE